MRGLAAEIREISVLFPAFGKPTRATSARSFSSNRNHRSSPCSPCSAKEGARLRFVKNFAFPLPPLPARTANHLSPVLTRSANGSSV